MSTALAQVFPLPEPEEELYIAVQEGRTEQAWGWGYSEETARACALDRVSWLDSEDPPGEGEADAETFVAGLHLVRVTVAHRDALSLLHLLGLTS